MKVTFVDHSSERGGAELALLRLADSLQGCQVTIIVPPPIGGEEDAFKVAPEGVAIERVGPHHPPRSSAKHGAVGAVSLATRVTRSMFALVRNRAFRGADVIVANTTRASVYVTAAALILRKPVIVHIRDLITANSIGSTATALMHRFVLPRADGVIANSTATLETVRSSLKRSCTAIVLASPAGITHGNAEDLATSPTLRRIGMVARIDSWKGQEEVLRAFAAAYPDSGPVLAFYGAPAFGNVAFLNHLKIVAARLGVSARVEFVGHVENVSRAIADLDVCVQYSLRPEPLGQNVLQYLAAGKPTVIASEGGPAEWVIDGENGLSVPPRDVPALAKALLKLDSAEIRDRLARAALATPGLLSDAQVAARFSQYVQTITPGASHSNHR